MYMDGGVLPESDQEGLQRLYLRDRVAEDVLGLLAKRERNPRDGELFVRSVLDKITDEGSTASNNDVVRVLKELEKHKCGRFIVGRRGHQSRFCFDVDIVAVARAVVASAGAIGEVDLGASLDNGKITHNYQLRPTLLVSVTLPADLSQSEATRLADFIETLPFDD